MPIPDHAITVGTLISLIQGYPTNKPIAFGCPELEFNRVKDRGTYLQIEFNQNVYADGKGGITVDVIPDN